MGQIDADVKSGKITPEEGERRKAAMARVGATTDFIAEGNALGDRKSAVEQARFKTGREVLDAEAKAEDAQKKVEAAEKAKQVADAQAANAQSRFATQGSKLYEQIDAFRDEEPAMRDVMAKYEERRRRNPNARMTVFERDTAAQLGLIDQYNALAAENQNAQANAANPGGRLGAAQRELQFQQGRIGQGRERMQGYDTQLRDITEQQDEHRRYGFPALRYGQQASESTLQGNLAEMQAKKTEEWAHAFIEAINKNGDLTSAFMKQVVAEMLRQGKTIEDIQHELNKLR